MPGGSQGGWVPGRSASSSQQVSRRGYASVCILLFRARGHTADATEMRAGGWVLAVAVRLFGSPFLKLVRGMNRQADVGVAVERARWAEQGRPHDVCSSRPFFFPFLPGKAGWLLATNPSPMAT